MRFIFAFVSSVCIFLGSDDCEAIQLNEEAGFSLNSKDVIGLMPISLACKPPAQFEAVEAFGYKGQALPNNSSLKSVDKENWYRFIDLNGDGVCEVEAETCNRANATDGSMHDSCADGWLRTYEFRSGHWARSTLPGGSGGEVFRGSASFYFFDRPSGRLRFIAYHDFFADKSAGPIFTITAIDYAIAAKKGENSALISRYDAYSDLGPLQHNGAYVPFIDLYLRRLIDEYSWRAKMCGGSVGYKDVDSRTLTLEELINIIKMFLIAPVVSQSKTVVEPKFQLMIEEWRKLAAQAFGSKGDPKEGPAVSPRDLCQSKDRRWQYIDIK